MARDISETFVDLMEEFSRQRDCQHGNYQEIPPSIPVHLRERLPDYPKTRLDSARYNWLDSYGVFTSKRILEIGANLGYFSIRAASERNARAVAYEPDNVLASAMGIIAKLSSVEDRVEIRSEEVTLCKWPELPCSDLVINLNVIHHAGRDFDTELVQTAEDWQSYAVKYLERLSTVAPLMVFQTGYTWGPWDGTARRLVPLGDDIDSWTRKLMYQAGWKAVARGKAACARDVWSYKDINEGDELRETAVINHVKELLTRLLHLLPLPLQQEIRIAKRQLLWRRTINTEIKRFGLRPLYICERL
jgi:hypothetical protein